MDYELHFFPDNASLTIRMVLEELGCSYEARLVDRRENAHRGEAFRRINPRGLIPALVDRKRDALLFETGAILLHISEVEDALGVPPENQKERANFLKWLFLISNTLHADLRLRYYSERFADEASAARSVHRQAGQRVTEHLGLLDRTISQSGSGYLLSGGLSVCDFYLASCLRWGLLYPGDSSLDPAPLEGWAALRRMVAELEQRPAVRRSLELEAIPGSAFTAPQRPDLSRL